MTWQDKLRKVEPYVAGEQPKIVNMIKAIRTICSSYGDDFILSWAPETFYVQLGYSFYGGINQYCDSRAGVYLPMINALETKHHMYMYSYIIQHLLQDLMELLIAWVQRKAQLQCVKCS